MKILVLGGTIFIGRRATRMLKDAGHDVAVLHRGTHEPDDLTDLVHIHGDRNDLPAVRSEIDAFGPDVVWDNMAMFGTDAEHVTSTLGKRPVRHDVVVRRVQGLRRTARRRRDGAGSLERGVGGSSGAVSVQGDDPGRLRRPVRQARRRGDLPRAWRDRAALPDVLRTERRAASRVVRPRTRIHAGRKRIPVGSGQWLTTKGYVEDIANGTKLAIENESVAGEIFNLGESFVYPMAQWTEMIVEASGAEVELVRVPDDKLPEDLGLTGLVPQHFVTDCSKARHMLGTTDTDHRDALKTTVAWHLEHPVQYEEEPDWSKDDEALEHAL